jgi:uncharacterized coiled-coil protein SlyX
MAVPESADERIEAKLKKLESKVSSQEKIIKQLETKVNTLLAELRRTQNDGK